MSEQFKLSGYKITTDPSFMDKQNHVNPRLKLEFERLQPQIQKGNKTVIRKLLRLIERNPQNPQLKNFLSAAYNAGGNNKKAIEVNDWILKEHPNYLFGKLNKAHQLIDEGRVKQVPEILGTKMELKDLYPFRDEFHLAEVTGFFYLAILYFATIEDMEQAEMRMDILNEFAPDHPDTKRARSTLLRIRMEIGTRRYEEDERTKISVPVPSYRKDIQTSEKPVFIHPEIEWLYQFDSKIDIEKLNIILSLKRETLIADLKTVLKDAVVRYEYYLELDEAGKLNETECFFALHAVYILGELEATESLDAILEVLKGDDDFLHFWFYDLLTETFWDILFKLGKNQLEKLKVFMLTPNIETYARTEIIQAVSQIILHFPERRQETIKWFKNIIDKFINSKPESGIIDSDQIGLMICDIVDFKGIELINEIEQLYSLGYVTVGISGSFESVKKDIYQKATFDYQNELTTIFELYKSLNEEPSQESDYDKYSPYEEPKQAYSQTVNNEISAPKVGRNEPCPCGSGKKFKKCCLNKLN